MAATTVSGSIYAYNASQLITIDAANQYHAVPGLIQNGCNCNVTYLASSSGSITDTANSGGNLRCIDAPHGLTTGQYLTLTGMTDSSHNGLTRVTVVDVDTFDCDDISYNSDDDTGTWNRGSSITVNTGRGGYFDVGFSISCSASGINKNYKFEVCKNATTVETIVAERLIATSGDLGNMSSSGIIELNGGDTIWLAVENTTDSTNLTIEHANFKLLRV